MSRIILILGVVTFIFVSGAEVRAQQTGAPNFIQTFESAFSAARSQCTSLWSDHVFDTLRKRIPLGGEKPSFEMLKSEEKLKPTEKPVAELAIKTLEKCRGVYAPVYAMLPPQVGAMIKGVERQQDSLVAELYRGKITFGDFNAGMNRLNGELSRALSGVQITSQTAEAGAQQPNKTVAIPLPLPSPRSLSERSNANAPAQINETRLALVIGNSTYVNLPKLSNPANDANAITDILKAMGYKTRLILDASEQSIRREVRQFASDSEKADVALVFYAGHGAQVNGSNYLLPVDIDIPRTEVDIQFSGLKVDDLVNSIRSNTKIVFLDACRDNPVLFKNIVKGRGSAPVGLAPAATSNFEQKAGGGVFIAYATDAGSIADDGHGKHSPFTQALLRNLQKPISIDDMFSLVTKEVRLVTKNTQRPYKYASLENIICVAPTCSGSVASTTPDIFQQAQRSQLDELQIALQTNNVDALETYLTKFPDTPRRVEIQNSIGKLRRAEFTEWTLVEIGEKRFPWWMNLSSIEKFGDRVAVAVKQTVVETDRDKKVIFGKPLPDAEYLVDVSVYDCREQVWATSEETILNRAGDTLFHYKIADPRYLDLSRGKIAAGTIAASLQKIACHDEINTPSVSKEQLVKMKFKSLSSTVNGDGELYYLALQSSPNTNDKELLFIFKFFGDQKLPIAASVSIEGLPTYRTQVDRMQLKCAERKLQSYRNEFFDSSNRLVFLGLGGLVPSNWIDILRNDSPLATLHRIFCGDEFGGLGIEVKIENKAVQIVKVMNGTGAAKGGIKPDDIITHIDDQPVNDVPLDQIVKKLRGPANTEVRLKLLRKGLDSPVELRVTREIIRTNPIEQVKK